MSGLLGNLVFLNPWLLSVLAALPALWFLLRLMPPAPKRIFLPSAVFLKGIVPSEKTPSHTPWWILLLRLLITALVILALAGPVLSPSQTLSGSGKIRILINNGWDSSHLWDTQIETARDLLAQAGRQNREVYITTSAPAPGQDKPLSYGPLSASEGEAILGGLTPLPWPSDYEDVRDTLGNESGIDTYWLSTGIEQANSKRLAKRLAQQGALYVYKPSAESLPAFLTFSEKESNAFAIHTPDAMPRGAPFTLQALDENGRVIGMQNISKTDNKSLETITLDIPDTLLNDVRQVRLAERSSAASTLILGNRFDKKTVGIVTPDADADAKPFIEASYYLTRALEPYADIRSGEMEDILSQNLSMIVLPDIAVIPAGVLNRLEKWVEDGGLLLRFAGPNMVDAQNFLLPVPLRSGKRSLDGALSWETPPKLSGFDESSPFYGLPIHEEIIIRQQLLAQPSQDLAEKTWASLDDGTPLITADRNGKGLLVMVHTTASPDWSDLPLAGVFVSIMERLVKLSGSAPDAIQNTSGILSPVWVLDGFGRRAEAQSYVQNIDATLIDDIVIDSAHPPGLYGRGAAQDALNLGPQLNSLKAFDDSFPNTEQHIYGNVYEQQLMPYLLAAAVILMLVDWIVVLLLSFNLSGFFRRAPAAMLIGFALLGAPAAVAEELPYANGLYLAYIKSGDPSVNDVSQRGLEGLSEALTRRTSAEPDGVAALNPETDTLSFFPFIYWPISPNDPPLSEAAFFNVQHYLDHGGTILFDTRGADIQSGIFQRVVGALNIPPLQPVPEGHVLGKSFYLLDEFPGLYNDGALWVESTSTSARDGVSSVIIGSNDWAGAWAQNQGRSYRSGSQARQREMATRFGVNLMMYALTGNYKADQVHVEQILERLGR